MRLGSDGRPDLRFGVGGISTPARAAPFDGNGLTLADGRALLTGRVFPRSGYDNRLGVERVRLTGSGIVAPRAHAWVQIHRRHGQAFVRVPISPTTRRSTDRSPCRCPQRR